MTQMIHQPTGNGQRQQIQKNPMDSIKSLFEAAKGKLKEVAPKHITPDRLMRVALLAISKNPDLARCTPHSLLNSFMTASQLGLEVGGVLGEAYLVPYKTEATFIVGYRGLINLARRSGQIATIEAQVVREGDEFEFEYGLKPLFRHKPIAGPDAAITHAWALARFKEEGVYQLDVMTIEQINAIRYRSRAGERGPWQSDFAEMAKKTVVRRLAKYLPLSPEMADAIEESDRAEFGDTFIDGHVVDAAEAKGKEKKADRLARQLEHDAAATSAPEAESSRVAPDDGPAPAEQQESPEPDTSGVEAEPQGDESQEDPAIVAARLPIAEFKKVLREKAIDHGVSKGEFDHGIFGFCTRNKVGDIAKLDEQQKATLYAAVCMNRLNYKDGTIKGE